MNDHAPSFACANDFIERFKRLGIPHFQRGLVWNDDATALLLESLYFGTPCGNIILWRPSDPGRHGEPCVVDGSCDDLIVDGQQRIRSLHGVWGGTRSDGKEWALDLTALPVFTKHLRGEDPSEQLFMPIAREAPDGRPTNQSLHQRMVRLRELMSGDAEPPRQYSAFCGRHGIPDDIKAAAWPSIGQAVRSMWQRRLFGLIELREQDGQFGTAEIVALYNRINSSGRRVEAEEMAYATLVRLYPDTTRHLRDFFKEIHGRAEENRDELLKRERERMFGFKLYLRTFVQVCNYHFARSSGTQGFSFDVIGSHELRKWFENPSSKPDDLFARTTAVLRCVHRVVTVVLHCDDLRMLPDTECLIPAIQLLVRYHHPGMLDGPHDRRIAYLILRRLVEPARTQEQTLALLKVIDNSHRAGACCEALAKKDGLAWSDRSLTQLEAALASANTLGDRYVLILYWLTRRNGAVDFCYDQLGESQRKLLPPMERPIARDASPEKQHICPSSALGRGIYGGAGRIATSRHPANNIGNLTYISHALNGLEGLSDTWMDTERESRCADNLARHFLAGDALKEYERLKGKVLTGEDRKVYEAFCAGRRALIQAKLVEWLADLRQGFADGDSRIEPEERLANRQPADFIRKLGYPDLIEDALIAMANPFANVQVTPEAGKGLQPPRVVLKVAMRGRSAGFRIEALSAPARIEIEEREGHRLFALLRDIMVRQGVERKSDGPRPWVLRCEPEDDVATARILADFVSELSRVTPEPK